MTRAQIALVALAVGSLLFYCGGGLVRLMAFAPIRGGEIALAPAVGAAVLVTVGSWCAVLGWSAGAALIVAVVAATIANLAALRASRAAPGAGMGSGGMLLALLPLLAGVAPLWTADRPATVIGRNGDQVFYTNIASYLERHGLPVPAPGPLDPAGTQRSFVDSYGVPLGFSSIQAMVDRLTGQPAYATFSVVTAVVLAMNVLAAVLLAERLFGLGRRSALAAGFLVAASPTLMWIHYNDYAMHALGIGLLPAALGVAVLALEDGAPRGLALAALLLSALCVSYPPGAGPFVLAPLGVYALASAWRGPEPGTVLRRGLVLGLLATALNLAPIAHVARVLRPMVGFILVKEFGDVSSHVSPAQLFGLTHHALPPLSAAPGALAAVLAAAAGGLAVCGAPIASTVGRRVFLALLVTAAPFLLWLRFGLDYPYGFYKGLTFLVWPAAVALALGVRRALGAPAVLAGGALAVLLALAVTSAVNLVRIGRAVTVLDLTPMMGLGALQRLTPPDQAVHVRDESGTALLWVTYFLQDRALYLGTESPYYLHRRWPFYQDAITAPLVLVNRDAVRVSPWDGGTVYENGRYRVARKEPAILAYLEFAPRPFALAPDGELRMSFLPDRTLVDGRSHGPVPDMAGGRTVALGLWAAGASTVRVRDGVDERVLHVNGVGGPVSWPGRAPPGEVVITNAGSRTVLVPGWLAVAAGARWPAVASAPEGPLGILREEVLPGSGFFAVSGWHGPEGRVRWSRAAGVAVFENPRRESILSIDCVLWRPGLTRVTTTAVLVNGRPLGDLVCSGRSSEVFPLPEAVLGGSPWGMLEIRVDPLFVPKAAGVSADDRDLGILVRGLRIEPVRAGVEGEARRADRVMLGGGVRYPPAVRAAAR
jgi:hypothetical protein